jgi:hypothetical protein
LESSAGDRPRWQTFEWKVVIASIAQKTAATNDCLAEHPVWEASAKSAAMNQAVPTRRFSVGFGTRVMAIIHFKLWAGQQTGSGRDSLIFRFAS